MTEEIDVRIHGDAIDFGNLTGLVGNWHGDNGFNLIAVPDQKGEFSLLVRPYTEDLIVSKVPATTPNRGLIVIENIPTLQYSTTISDLLLKTLMHVECGFWELASLSARNNGFDIFRIASVPHGNAVEAMGVSSVADGPPVIDITVSSMPTGDLPPLSGYTDPYLRSEFPDFTPVFPNEFLANFLKKQEASGLKVTKTVTLQVSTQNRGGINNIASLQTNANPIEFDATYWIETLEDGQGNVFRQLQYSQRVMIEFPIKTDLSGQTILWPHINVNTLTLIT